MPVDELYGVRASSMEAVKSLLETALALDFEARHSLYHRNYFLAGHEGDTFMLKGNLDPFDDEPAEREFPACPLLLYVKAAGNNTAFEHALLESGCLLLRRSTVAKD